MRTTFVVAVTVSMMAARTVAAVEFVGTTVRLGINAANSTGKFHINTDSDFCMTADNIDFPNGDFMSVRGGSDACCNLCRKNGCMVYTWTNYQGGTCWLKNQFYPAKILIGAKGCIHTQNERLASSFENCDMPGNDLSNHRESSQMGCGDSCWTTAGCKAATWTNYEGGTCWLKTAVTECVSYPGATTNVVFKAA